MDALSNNPPLADRLVIEYAGLQSEIAQALDGIALPSIASDADVEAAGNIVKPLKSLQGKVETARKGEKATILADGKTVDEFFAGLRAVLDQIVTDITKAATDYQTKKREEARKLEAIKARVAAAVGDAAPATVAPKETTRVTGASGVVASGTVKWDYEIVNAADLPRELLQPNEAAIKTRLAGLKAQGIRIDDAKVPGLRIFEKISTAWR